MACAAIIRGGIRAGLKEALALNLYVPRSKRGFFTVVEVITGSYHRVMCFAIRFQPLFCFSFPLGQSFALCWCVLDWRRTFEWRRICRWRGRRRRILLRLNGSYTVSGRSHRGQCKQDAGCSSHTSSCRNCILSRFIPGSILRALVFHYLLEWVTFVLPAIRWAAIASYTLGTRPLPSSMAK